MIKELPKYLLRQKAAITLIIAFVILVAAMPTPVSGMKLTGAILRGSADPGGHVSFDMSVGLEMNETSTNMTLDILDWKQDLYGRNNAVESYPTPYSAKDMLTVTPKSFHLEPNATQNVAIEANIPADAKPGGRYAIISVHSADDATSKEGVSARVAINALVIITVSGEGIEQIGEISSLAMADPISSKQQEGSLIFNNTGNILYKILTNEVIKDESGKVVAKASVPSGSSIMPGAAGLITFSFQPTSPLQPGIYTLDANVSLEDGTALATKSTTFQL